MLIEGEFAEKLLAATNVDEFEDIYIAETGWLDLRIDYPIEDSPNRKIWEHFFYLVENEDPFSWDADPDEPNNT